MNIVLFVFYCVVVVAIIIVGVIISNLYIDIHHLQKGLKEMENRTIYLIGKQREIVQLVMDMGKDISIGHLGRSIKSDTQK